VLQTRLAKSEVAFQCEFGEVVYTVAKSDLLPYSLVAPILPLTSCCAFENHFAILLLFTLDLASESLLSTLMHL
jgi:hypothetical protein